MSRKVIKIGCGRLCDDEGEIYSHWRPCSKCRLRNNKDDCKYYRHLMDVTANFNVSKIDGHHDVVGKFKNYHLTADDYRWAFNTYSEQFKELLE